ncbi:hypothetical protein HEB94_002494 [Actinopolymorpha pittospori]|uniref:Uncharacterized protein n=1 Tax=Actinopolymorpha pittospori TaxID=648752 RepID=A0A927MRQ0_9ACTN|nr:hypothetical protein [Actinopolymorpha pittospori]
MTRRAVLNRLLAKLLRDVAAMFDGHVVRPARWSRP